MGNVPEVIYLQLEDDGLDADWCEDRIWGSDVKYVRVDDPRMEGDEEILRMYLEGNLDDLYLAALKWKVTARVWAMTERSEGDSCT